jgi:hypothetical protein
MIEVFVNDRTQYDVGTKQLVSILREQQVQRVVYLGKDLNPALDLYLRGWDTWREDVRVDYHLVEATALAPKGTAIDLSGLGEGDFLVEENRIANEHHDVNLLNLKEKVSPFFSNNTYHAYKLSSSK